MNPTEFLRSLEDEKIVAAIAEAERRTSGEIRVWISRKQITDALAAAQRRFRKLRMARTRHRNAVLLYFAPRAQKFAIVGDVAVHEHCGDEFWQKLAVQLARDIHQMPMTDAIIAAIRTVGYLLAAHFPPDPDDTNELPNTVERD
jgi:uncharacterized membrane protein